MRCVTVTKASICIANLVDGDEAGVVPSGVPSSTEFRLTFLLMPEASEACEHHRHAVLVSCIDYLLVPD